MFNSCEFVVILRLIRGKYELKMQKKAKKESKSGGFSCLSWKNKANLPAGWIGLKYYMKGRYEEFHGFGRRKNKANSKPMLGKGKSKKAKGKMRANPAFLRWAIWKNKPNLPAAKLAQTLIWKDIMVINQSEGHEKTKPISYFVCSISYVVFWKNKLVLSPFGYAQGKLRRM